MIPIFIFVVLILSFIVGCILYGNTKSESLSVKGQVLMIFSGILLFPTTLFCTLEPNKNYTTYTPTTIQQIVETGREAIAITPTETFTTTNLSQMNEWKLNLPKYIKEEYNCFGFPLSHNRALVAKESIE